jgi:hypothetical protein
MGLMRGIRKNVKGIYWVVIVVVVVTFVLWGTRFGGARAPKYAGTVFGKKVTFDDFNRQWRAAVQQARQYEAWGGNITIEQIEAWAWERVVKLREADRWGVVVPTNIVRERITDMFSAQGEFHEQVYRSYLQRMRVSEREFAALVRDDLRIATLEQLVSNAVVATPQELREQYNYDKEQRKISFHMVEVDSLLPAFEVAGNAEQYYRTHQEEFREPRKVAVQYVMVEKEPFLEKVSLAEEEIRSYYEENKSAYKGADGGVAGFDEVKPQIERLLKARKADEMARQQAEELLGFSDVSKMREVAQKDELLFRETGLIPEKGLVSDPLAREAPFRDAAFRTPLGELSSIIETKTGYCVLSPIRAVDARTPPFEEVREVAAERERANRLKGIASRAGVPPEKLDVFVKEHSTIPAGIDVSDDDARRYYESPSNKSEFMKQKKVKVQYLVVEKEPFEKEVRVTQREMRAEYKDNEEKYKDENGKVKPFADVKEDIEKELRTAKADEMARERAEQVFAVYRPQRMKQQAEKHGLTLRESRLFARGEMIDDYMTDAATFTTEAFRTEIGDVSDIFSTEKGYCVLSPIQVVDESVSDFEDVAQDVAEKAKMEKAENLCVQIAGDLHRQVREKTIREKTDFQTACKELGLNLEESGYFRRDDASIEKVGSTRGFTRTIFETDPDQIGTPKRVPRGAFFYVVSDVKLPTEEELSEDKKLYYSRLVNEKTQQARQEWGAALLREANIRRSYPPISKKAPK